MNLLEYFFTIKKERAFKFLIAWVIFLSILYSILAVLRHDHFQSGAFDLGIYDQAIWQYSRFEFPYNTIKERFILGDHFTLTLPLLAPLFYIWEDARIILIFQAFFITFSTLGIYKISLLRKLSPFVALLVSVVYSLFYGIQTAVSFDFHPIVIAVGMLTWVGYFFESKKRKLFLVFLILFLLTQENTGISLAGLGFIYLFHKEYRKQALLFILGGIAISIIETRIIAFLSPVGYQYTPHISNPATWIIDFFNAPEKMQNWWFSLAPFAFLPILSPGAMLAVFADLSQYYLTGFDRMWTPYQHHRAILAVFITFGLIDVLVFLRSRKININYIILAVFFVCIFSQYFFHFPLNKLIKKEYWAYGAWMGDNIKLFQKIPKEASLAAPQNLVPHLSHRKEIYLVWPREKSNFSYCEKTSCWWLDFAGRPEFLFVNLYPGQSLTQLLESSENFIRAVRNMEEAKKIVLVQEVGFARLYKINY